MKKFDVWNQKKKILNDSGTYQHTKRREIWWTSVGENIGVEQNGKNELFERPVLVFRIFNEKMFLGIPMTSAHKNKKSFYYFSTKHDNKTYFLILPQIRLFSTKRLIRFVRRIEPDEFLEIKQAVKKLLKLGDV